MSNDGLVLPDKHIALSCSSAVNDICKKFMNEFGINYFRFLRIYKNGSRICLSTNPIWTRLFFEKKFYTIAWFDNKSVDFYKSGNTLWDQRAITEDNEVGIAARDCDMYHGYTIVKSSDSCCEFFDFTSRKDNYIINELYVGYPQLFNHFTLYFKDKARKLINIANNSKIIIPGINNKIKKENKNGLEEKVYKFINETNIKRFFFDDNSYLSKKEVEVLSLYSKGMTMREISEIIGISRRTVETHIRKAKYKFNCGNTKELIHICHDIGII